MMYVLFLLIAAPSLYAEEGIRFSLSPSYTQLLIQPGKNAPLTYELINQGDPSTFSFHIYRINQKDQQGLNEQHVESFSDNNRTDNSIQFTSIEKESLDESFFLNSRQKKTMRLTITTSEKNRGDYYYGITAYNEPAGRVSDGSLIARIKTGAASVLFITISQNGVIDADPVISSFTLSGSSYPTFRTISVFDSFDPIRPLLHVKNNGRNFISADGELTVKNIFGLSSKQPLTSSTILSESSRTIPLARTYLQTLLPGNYTADSRIIIHNPHTKETITTLHASYQFYVIPAKLIVGCIVILLAIFFIRVKRKECQKKLVK